MEEALVVEAELGRHGLAVLENFETRRKLHRREVLHFLQQREVAVRLDVAGNPRIAIPIPGAADVAALLTKANILKTGFPQLVPEHEPSEAGADDENFALVGERLALDRFSRVDVFHVATEVAVHGHVIGSTTPRLFELAVLRLLFSIEGGAGWLGRHLRQSVINDGVATALYAVHPASGTSSENLQACIGIDGDRHRGVSPVVCRCTVGCRCAVA
jgi:hypothetical protein